MWTFIILVDEYDKPLLQALLDENLLDEYRRILKAFYGVLKSSDRYLRFIFLTGVTKFAQVRSKLPPVRSARPMLPWKSTSPENIQ